jgi:hypothetical protein
LAFLPVRARALSSGGTLEIRGRASLQVLPGDVRAVMSGVPTALYLVL